MRGGLKAAGFAVTIGALGLPLFAVPAGASGPSPRVNIAGTHPAWAQPSSARGHADRAKQIEIQVYLGSGDSAAMTALARAVSDPTSPQYGDYLTADQFRAQFAPSAAEAASVVSYLTSAGLKVQDVPANRLYVDAVGTVAQVEAAFGTTLNEYAHSGRIEQAPASDATVPANLSASVIGVGGLSDGVTMNPKTSSEPPSPAFVNAPPCSPYYGAIAATGTPKFQGATAPYAVCGYTPVQLQGAYGTTSAIKAGLDGSGVTVAITDAYASPTIKTDANTYAARHGQPTFTKGQFTQVMPSKGFREQAACDPQGWYGEETLDVEAVHSMAPGANVVYVAGRSCTDQDLLVALNTVVDGHLAQIVTNSWGDIGEDVPTAILKAYQQVFFQAVIEGIGMYFSSGDDGDDSTATADGSTAVDFPASNPLVTAVGGTSLGVTKNNGYDFETGWGTGKSTLTNNQWSPAPPGAFLYGAGGGTSQLFSEPWYQVGVVPQNLVTRYGGSGRVVPDIAADADPNTGMLVGQTQTFPAGHSLCPGNKLVCYSEYRIGGTSLASPLIAGIMAIADQVYGRPHGFANPAFYQLVGTKSVNDVKGAGVTRANVRNDFVNGVDASDGISTSLRSMNFTESLKVRPGYDDVTGVGTPRGNAFLSKVGYTK